MLGKVKQSLRVNSSSFDTEVSDLMLAAVRDLALAGVKPPAEPTQDGYGDALYDRAVILYCKAHFGYDEGTERYTEAYEHIKRALILSREFEGEQ